MAVLRWCGARLARLGYRLRHAEEIAVVGVVESGGELGKVHGMGLDCLTRSRVSLGWTLLHIVYLKYITLLRGINN
jgi:hypothetical protein